MKRSTLLKLLVIPALAIFVPMLHSKPAAAACYCNTAADCQRCLHTTEPMSCGFGGSQHICIYL